MKNNNNSFPIIYKNESLLCSWSSYDFIFILKFGHSSLKAPSLNNCDQGWYASYTSLKDLFIIYYLKHYGDTWIDNKILFVFKSTFQTTNPQLSSMRRCY